MSELNTLKELLEATEVDGSFFRRGLEREALRVDPEGSLARDPHPEYFGSKLYHPHITTDFSESQLELITPVHSEVNSLLTELEQIHRFVYGGLGSQLLWASSMPCVLNNDDSIPLADYGPSNLGQLKKTYRRGLGYRYGRAMQTICAVHYNLSFTDPFWNQLGKIEKNGDDKNIFRSKRSFDLMRNFRRFSWLLIYLFGASPAICKSFVKGREHRLVQFDEGSLFLEHATSLRSGNLGYQSDTQRNSIRICYNSLSNYVKTLAEAITTPLDIYEKISLNDMNGFNQVSASILQSEAEFYTSVRAKCVPPPGENFLGVLQQKGVEYIEMRLLDLNPYEPLGISSSQIHFLDLFAVYCLLHDSPEHCDQLCSLVHENFSKTVTEGRNPMLKLHDGNREILLTDWGKSLLDDMRPLAEQLDRQNGSTDMTDSLADQYAKLENSSLTPSARILADMSRENVSFFRHTMNLSRSHKERLLQLQLPESRQLEFEQIARLSIEKQQKQDARKEISFAKYLETFLKSYQTLLQEK